jgi:hypothetical protein
MSEAPCAATPATDSQLRKDTIAGHLNTIWPPTREVPRLRRHHANLQERPRDGYSDHHQKNLRPTTQCYSPDDRGGSPILVPLAMMESTADWVDAEILPSNRIAIIPIYRFLFFSLDLSLLRKPPPQMEDPVERARGYSWGYPSPRHRRQNHRQVEQSRHAGEARRRQCRVSYIHQD